MGFLNNIFGKKSEEQKVGGMEDFMTLIRVYFQSALAANLSISNLAMLPDLRVFKTTLHVPTVNNKLGVGERQRCRKMLQEMYGMSDLFFKEIDASIKKRCRKIQDVQAYMLQFQDFSQCLMMLMGNLMKFKLRLPSFMKKAFYAMTEKTVTQLFNKNDYSDPSVMKSVLTVREYVSRLGFSQPWITEYVYNVVMLAKKEPAPKDSEVKK
ncbi:MAG: hypothetical protein MSA35_09115 [Prevotella sp.]|nr:hypothetical protein [Prevotella sp.]